jgi:hypothetical protein
MRPINAITEPKMISTGVVGIRRSLARNGAPQMMREMTSRSVISAVIKYQPLVGINPMFAFETLVYLFASEGFFAHDIVTLWTLFVDWFKIGDKFTFGVGSTTKEFASFSFTFLYLVSTEWAGYF